MLLISNQIILPKNTLGKRAEEKQIDKIPTSIAREINRFKAVGGNATLEVDEQNKRLYITLHRGVTPQNPDIAGAFMQRIQKAAENQEEADKWSVDVVVG